MVRVTRPALMLSCKCKNGIEVTFSVKPNCEGTQENTAVVIFCKKNCRSFFIVCGKKTGGERKEKHHVSTHIFYEMKG